LEHLDELKTQIDGDKSRIVLDLDSVTLVDVEVVRFLSACEERGIELIHCWPYIREWIIREKVTEGKGSENASAKPPASLLAVFVADEYAQLTTFDSEAHGWSNTVGYSGGCGVHIRSRNHPVIGCTMKTPTSASFAESPLSQAYDSTN